MASQKSDSLGPNDKCFAAAADPSHTPMQSEKGQILPGSVDELSAQAREATRSGEHTKAAHFFTMALDSVTKGMSRDRDGFAAEADLVKFNSSSKGALAQILSERSAVYLKLGDFAAAVEDADASSRADPESERGHMRLAVAQEAACIPLHVQLEACERGLESCSTSELLTKRKWRLKKAIAEQPLGAAPTPTPEAPDADDNNSRLATVRRLADDTKDPRRPMAASDLGSVLAAGSHGVAKDLPQAERYLRIGSEGGDVAAQRNLGLVLLELDQPEEAVLVLSKAAESGDEHAAVVLKQLVDEADAQAAEARTTLKAMAANGDARAAHVLSEMGGA